MNEVLRQLLAAEHAGRQLAQRMEQEAEQILLQARAQSEQIARQGRLDVAREIEALQVHVRQQTETSRQAIASEADGHVERMQALAAQCRAAAVARVVAILLGEAKP
jgi:vacuolar-type H+-ATPase subunit H